MNPETVHPLRLMCVLAHPDDESLGTGGTLARYAAEGIETYVVTATRGERGYRGDPEDDPGLDAFGRIREAELCAAAKVLGVREVSFLDYVDGELDRADASEAIAKIVAHIRRIQPQVVITFAPDGAYGHPDHIAICQFTTAALVVAADPEFASTELAPHRVSKFYYKVWTGEEMAAYQSVFGDLVMNIDGVERRTVAWQDWAVTTRINTEAYWQTVKQAVAQHRSQMPVYRMLLDELPEEHHRGLWGVQGYYRAYSLVNGGRQLERDLFEGLRK
jgi:LmbE family N-acetylglucosaminyl deacetylase